VILVCGGIKGGVGKTTFATNMSCIFALEGRDVLLIDADDQATASDFTALRNENLAQSGGAGYTSVKVNGAAVRTEVLRLASKYTDIVIDVGGRDTAGQRAALAIGDVYAVPFMPASFDVWTLDKVSQLIEEARAFNEKLQAVCFLNRADVGGQDNLDAIEIAKEMPGLRYIDAPLSNRKAFRTAASKGLSVTELKPGDSKAAAEMRILFDRITSIPSEKKQTQLVRTA
jgi:chromosome partitioning protein